MGCRWSARTARWRCCNAPRERPVHAYLLVGPRGSGIETAARCFAALLIGADGDERVLRGRHPDVVEFRPVATMYSVERDVRDAILPAVHASPVETERKCVVLLEADRLNPESSNTLLKSIEEPPPRTIIILVAESAAELLDTIRSRCQQIDFGALGTDVLLAELERRGVPEARARLAAALAGGRLDRAVALTGPLAGLRDAFVDVPARVDGTGATALALAEGLGEVVKDTLAGLEAEQKAELDELEEEIERRAVRAPHRAGDAQAGHRPAEAARRAARGSTRCSRASPRSSPCTATRSPTASPPLNADRERARRRTRRPRPGRSTPAGRPATPSSSIRARVCSSNGCVLHLPAGAGSAPRLNCRHPAGIAQSVEQLTRNEQVRSSNLLPGSKAANFTGTAVKIPPRWLAARGDPWFGGDTGTAGRAGAEADRAVIDGRAATSQQ